MNKVRIGVIGLGNMGSCHARMIGQIRGAELAAVCDIVRSKADSFASELSCKAWYDSKKLIASGEVDAVIIATPHYSHTTIGIDALRRGLHVLVEKPISAHKADCRRLIAAHRSKKQVFAAMFNQRTDPHYIKVRDMVRSGKLGKLVRVTWLITDWFRSEAYYRSSDWRATWVGEGGGVLLNQCPHNLDLLQWICGMPTTVKAECKLGKHHRIEVEDEVNAYLEFRGGATGNFITTTGEAPGTNRLEICGDRGKVVLENGHIHFTRNKVATSVFNRTTKELFDMPPRQEYDIEVKGVGGQHGQIIQDFVGSIRRGGRPIAPAEEGIHSVELANAMLLSSQTRKAVKLPMSAAEYERTLKKLIAGSRPRKRSATAAGEVDMSKSFGR